jgi:hypothetical protein
MNDARTYAAPARNGPTPGLMSVWQRALDVIFTLSLAI